MCAAFQDRENLHLVLDFMPGGDLRAFSRHAKSISEEQASIHRLMFYDEVEFIVACVMCGLEYLHTKGVVHKDIKPANLVIDEDGYVRITDFGISQVMAKDKSPDISGTPGYMGTLLHK